MIVGYVRVSTGKQHPENQRDEISRYASANNWEIDKWVAEIELREHIQEKLPCALCTISCKLTVKLETSVRRSRSEDKNRLRNGTVYCEGDFKVRAHLVNSASIVLECGVDLGAVDAEENVVAFLDVRGRHCCCLSQADRSHKEADKN